jgi:ethanolamine utilization cobalamin adenosyltransferase
MGTGASCDGVIIRVVTDEPFEKPKPPHPRAANIMIIRENKEIEFRSRIESLHAVYRRG